jgi:hypothetical protein
MFKTEVDLYVTVAGSSRQLVHRVQAARALGTLLGSPGAVILRMTQSSDRLPTGGRAALRLYPWGERRTVSPRRG